MYGVLSKRGLNPIWFISGSIIKNRWDYASHRERESDNRLSFFLLGGRGSPSRLLFFLYIVGTTTTGWVWVVLLGIGAVATNVLSFCVISTTISAWVVAMILIPSASSLSIVVVLILRLHLDCIVWVGYDIRIRSLRWTELFDKVINMSGVILLLSENIGACSDLFD